MHVISFFSFKGGVGRTYLMVNVAYALAKGGAFVVVSDWDLHAPGLTVMERMHRPEPESDEENKARRNPDVRKGVLDYIQGALHPYDDDGVPDPMTMAKPTRLGQNARKRDEEGLDSFKGDIWFIPAGRFNPTGSNKEYHDQLLNVMGHDLSDWIMEPEKGSSEPQLLVEFFCERVIEVKHPDMDNRPPDFLLIDSRTGLTEIGDLLLKAESVNRMVLVSGFNDQNLTGLEAVIRDVQTVVEHNELSSRLSVVLSPVPQGEEWLKRKRIRKFKTLLESLAREKNGVIENMPDIYYVPYHPHVALNEDLMVESYPETDIAKAVFSIVNEDIKGKSNWSAIKEDTEKQTHESLEKVGILPEKEKPERKVSTLKRHPRATLPRWNWPDVSLTVEKFLPESTNPGITEELMNMFANSISLSRDEKLRILKSLATINEAKIEVLYETLKNEQKNYSALSKNSWVQLTISNAGSFLEWLKVWCSRLYPESIDDARVKILDDLLTKKKDGDIGYWTESNVFWFGIAEKLKQEHAKKPFEKLAELAYKRSIELEPEYVPALGNYAIFLDDVRKDIDKAEEYYKKALDIEPNNAKTLSNYAVFLKNVRKDTDKAEEYYRKALDIEPNTVGILGNYAVFLNDVRKDMDKAEEYYRKALDIEPNNADNLGNYAGLLLSLGRYDEGFGFLSQAFTFAEAGSALLLELHFYQYAHTSDEASRRLSLKKLSKLLADGVRSHGWNLKDNVARAIKDGHPESEEFLTTIAAVIAEEKPLAALGDFEPWKAITRVSGG